MIHKVFPINQMFMVLSAVSLVLSACSGSDGWITETPDAVYYNGKVITVDSSDSIMESFAVKGDRFLAVGTSDEMLELVGPESELVDLRGGSVMPGLMDNHSHAFHAANAYRGMDLDDVASLADLLERVRAAAVAAPTGEAIYGRYGWDLGRFPEERSPTRVELDAAAPNNPVVIYLSRGQAFLNSHALRLAGVTRYSSNCKGF